MADYMVAIVNSDGYSFFVGPCDHEEAQEWVNVYTIAGERSATLIPIPGWFFRRAW
jgi:hypothetical protein